jgi:hypothetical protein
MRAIANSGQKNPHTSEMLFAPLPIVKSYTAIKKFSTPLPLFS